MENIILPFILGLLAGFFVSSGVGPLGITAITKSLEESFLSGFLVGVGVAILDMFYSAIALFGLSSFFDYHFIKLAFQIIGIPLLVFLAIKSFKYKIVLNDENKKLPKIKYHNSILIGVSIYLANPTFLPLWIGIVGILHSRELLNLSSQEGNYSFIIGVGLGTLLWFYALLRLIGKFNLLAKPTIIKKVFFVSGIFLLFSALYLLYQLIL